MFSLMTGHNAYVFPEQSSDSPPQNRAEIPHRRCTTNAKTQINTAPRHHQLTQQGSTADSTHEATINKAPRHLHSAAFLGSGHPRSTQQVATSTSIYCSVYC
ncbi:uncharacterized protein DS421_2g42310 [Arachis hypogaea]|nr:uncharacterized protein DS421_2g42310 [Arachis hypogaea]